MVLVISLLPMSAFAATVAAKKTCETEEHTHTDQCYEATGEVEKVLICEKQTEGHVHTDDCYAWTYKLACDEAETDETPHTHTDACYETYTLLSCGGEEHTHGSGCYEKKLTCGEDHEHNDGCYTDELTCTIPEHTHGDSCYTQEKKLTCTQPDQAGHKHTEACYTRERGELICTLEEDAQPHEHTEECYEEREVKELICGKQEHKHDKDCFTNTTEDGKSLEQALQEALEAAGKNGAEDKEVILVLNGQTLNYGANGKTAIEIRNGQELTIQDVIGGGGIHGSTGDGSKNLRLIIVTNGTVNLEGGTLSGGKAEGGGAVYVSGGNSTVNMTGGTISGNRANSDDGGAVLVENGGKFEMSGGTISNNTAASTNGGGVSVRNGGKFEMSGGSITGNTANGMGGGVSVGKDSQFTMTGGSITGNQTDTGRYDAKNEPVGQGGGVAVDAGGSFSLSGGAISGNTAGEGGGVFVDRESASAKGAFSMTGGVIDGNTAVLGEGGGVYVKGEGEITGGAITNNATYTHKDLGGGGIYIEADGVLTLKNAIITGNTANGMGGGIAACVHGKTYVYALEGAVITGNNALGQGHTEGYDRGDGTYNGSFIDGYSYWAAAEDVVKNAAQDIFAAGDAFEASLAKPGTATNGQGTAGIIVSNNLPGSGGGTTNWKGYTFSYVTNEDGTAKKDSYGNYIFELTEVTNENNGIVYGNRLVFLTADPSQESVQKAIEAMQGGVIISGNLSANSHGGGIANNGVLTIGEGPMTGMNSKAAETELTKNLESNDESVTIADKTFTFELRDESGSLVEGGSVTNDGNGKATFSFPPEYFNDVQFPEGEDEVEYVFYVSEKNDGQANVTYDGARYKVVIKITRTTEQVKLGQELVTMETLSIGEPQILVAVVDEDGGVTGYETAPNGIVFNNKYTKPTEPTDPPGGGDDGDDPGDEVLPPTEEVPEPEVPLEELPEEPERREETELEDPDVPLSDVPQTGDISLGWYGAGILSALGLLMLSIFGRKKSQED